MASRQFNLDLSRFAREAPYGVAVNDKQFDLATIPTILRPTFEEWGRKGIITGDESSGYESFGYAMGRPDPETWLPNSPYEAIWFVAGWGPEADQRIADAVRMLAALWRLRYDSTLQVRLEGRRHRLREVESVVDGQFPYGNIVRGGAAWVYVGDLTLPCAAGGPNEVDNNLLAKITGYHIGTAMLRLRSDGPFVA